MDFNLIKKVLEKEKGKIIIVEDGKPTMVVYRFEDYFTEPAVESDNPGEESEAPPLEEEEAMPMRGSQEGEEEQIFLPKEGEEGLSIDDLPL